jgi:hypothetical protein
MPTTYLQHVIKAVQTLANDEELQVEGRLVLLDMMREHITQTMTKLEEGLSLEADSEVS